MQIADHNYKDPISEMRLPSEVTASRVLREYVNTIGQDNHVAVRARCLMVAALNNFHTHHRSRCREGRARHALRVGKANGFIDGDDVILRCD